VTKHPPKLYRLWLTVGGAGRCPIAPGTAASALVAALFVLLAAAGTPTPYLAIVMAVIALHGAAVTLLYADRLIADLGPDPKCLVSDEQSGQALTYLGCFLLAPRLTSTTHLALYACAGFLLFRLFDILKPPPAKQLENAPGAWGVLLDDLAAGLYALLILNLAAWRLLPHPAPAPLAPPDTLTAAAAAPAMTAFHAIVLGLVEGLTEYLPISSTGHLLVAQRLMGIDADKTSADAYAVCIQLGAILAVLWLYWPRVKTLALGLCGRNPPGRALLLRLLLAFTPAVVGGVLLEKQIKALLFGPVPIAIAWIVGGLAILALEHRRAQRRKLLSPDHSTPTGLTLEQLTLQAALLIGLLQCLAMWPGTSRSLMTILAGLLVGLQLRAALEFSFLLGLLTLSAATAYDALQHGRHIVHAFGWANPLLGLAVAFLAAVLAIKWMLAYLDRHSLAVFGFYRIALGLLLALWLYLAPS